MSKPVCKWYFCFYHVYTIKHTNYHHVIISTDDLDVIKSMDSDTYQYCLISALPVNLDQRDLESNPIIRGLVMDGESLFKRFKAQRNKQIFSKAIEAWE